MNYRLFVRAELRVWLGCIFDKRRQCNLRRLKPLTSNHVYQSTLLCEFPRCLSSSYRHPTSLIRTILGREHTSCLAIQPISCHDHLECTLYIHIHQGRTNPWFNNRSRASGRSHSIRNATLHIPNIRSITTLSCRITARTLWRQIYCKTRLG